MHAFLAPAELAYAFLARVLRTAAPSLAGVLSGTRPASLRSYSEGSYHTCLPVQHQAVQRRPLPFQSIARLEFRDFK